MQAAKSAAAHAEDDVSGAAILRQMVNDIINIGNELCVNAGGIEIIGHFGNVDEHFRRQIVFFPRRTEDDFVAFGQCNGVFVLEYGIQNNKYGRAIAAGMFKSVIGIILLFAANFVAKKLDEDTLL